MTAICENLWAHVHEPVPDLRTVRPDLPAPLIEAVTAALAKDPDDRPVVGRGVRSGRPRRR